MMTTTAKALELGGRSLPERRGIPDPRREAMWLLARAWGVEEIALRLHPEREVPAEVEARYNDWLQRRAAGEPAHHLTGSCEFWGRDFAVSSAVLVPRPETELLVQVVLDLPLSPTARVLDVGTGSGCIAITMAAERPKWRGFAVDRSASALEIARSNARRHGVVVANHRVESGTEQVVQGHCAVRIAANRIVARLVERKACSSPSASRHREIGLHRTPPRTGGFQRAT